MVKNKAIPISMILAASIVLSSQPMFVDALKKSEPKQKTHNEAHYPEYKEKQGKQGKHKAMQSTIDNTHNNNYYVTRTDGYQHDNNNDDKTKIVVEEMPVEYIDALPINYGLSPALRPNVVTRIEEVNNIGINGAIPQISGMNARAAERINERIRASFVNLVNAGHRNIEADFEVYNWGGMTSLVIRYQMAGSRQVVNTFVFDHVTKSEITLRNLLGRDFMSYVNNRIETGLRPNNNGGHPSNITNFRTIRANQSFYVKDGNIHIVFEQSRVAHERYGVVEFVMPIETLSYTLSPTQFAIKDGTTFVPATVARRFGMDVNLTQGGVMHITSRENRVSVDVHNERKNPQEVTYMNGYDVALSAGFLKDALGIRVEQVPHSREIIVTYRFNR